MTELGISEVTQRALMTTGDPEQDLKYRGIHQGADPQYGRIPTIRIRPIVAMMTSWIICPMWN